MISVALTVPAPSVSTRVRRTYASPALSGQDVDMSEYVPVKEVVLNYVPVQEVEAEYIRRGGLRAKTARLIFNIKQGS